VVGDAGDELGEVAAREVPRTEAASARPPCRSRPPGRRRRRARARGMAKAPRRATPRPATSPRRAADSRVSNPHTMAARRLTRRRRRPRSGPSAQHLPRPADGRRGFAPAGGAALARPLARARSTTATTRPAGAQHRRRAAARSVATRTTSSAPTTDGCCGSSHATSRARPQDIRERLRVRVAPARRAPARAHERQRPAGRRRATRGHPPRQTRPPLGAAAVKTGGHS
jgi:hypothetical protein